MESQGNQMSKWSEFVETNKFFSPPIRCQSVPCMQPEKKKKNHITAPTIFKLSLSWQLACDPVVSDFGRGDSNHLNAAKLNLPKLTKDLKPLTSKLRDKLKVKSRPRQPIRKPKMPKVLPKIVILDAQQEKKKDTPQKNPKEKNEKGKLDKPKRSYGVPLCSRPTIILGSERRSMLQQQQQLNYQYQLEMQEYQQWQQQHQQQQEKLMFTPLKHMSRSPKWESQYDQVPKYGVPIESMCHNLRKGNRYCGNFYYK